MHAWRAILVIFVFFYCVVPHCERSCVHMTKVCQDQPGTTRLLGGLNKHVLIVTSNMPLNLVLFLELLA
jgi:hypothetical protein